MMYLKKNSLGNTPLCFQAKLFISPPSVYNLCCRHLQTKKNYLTGFPLVLHLNDEQLLLSLDLIQPY